MKEQLQHRLSSWRYVIERHARRIFNAVEAEEVVLRRSREGLYIQLRRGGRLTIPAPAEALASPKLRNELKAWRLAVGRAVGEAGASVKEAEMHIFSDGRYVLRVVAARGESEEAVLIEGTLAPIPV